MRIEIGANEAGQRTDKFMRKVTWGCTFKQNI